VHLTIGASIDDSSFACWDERASAAQNGGARGKVKD